MESKNNDKDRVLCTNCVAFYGTVDTEYLCSKCFKGKKEEEVHANQMSNGISSNLMSDSLRLSSLLEDEIVDSPMTIGSCEN